MFYFQFCECNAILAEGLSFLGDPKIDSTGEIFTIKKKFKRNETVR